MKAGRELDALVANKVMGLKPKHFNRSQSYYELASDGAALKSYSTDIAAAWEVVEKAGVLALYQIPNGWRAVIGRGEWTADASTAPEVICLAALKAVGVDI